MSGTGGAKASTAGRLSAGAQAQRRLGAAYVSPGESLQTARGGQFVGLTGRVAVIIFSAYQLTFTRD